MRPGIRIRTVEAGREAPRGAAVAESILPGHTWPLVGREAEMTEIAAALDPGGARSVVLAGDPGFGRSRLLLEALQRASAAANPVECVVATRAAASVPFGAISALLPDVPRPDVPRPIAEHLEQWRSALGQSDTRMAGRRLILGVDDAHLLDEQSAALIHQLVIQGTLAVVVTLRAGEPAPDAVTALWKDGLARRLTVRPLPPAAVEALTGHVLGPYIDGRVRKHIQRVTAGNPLILRELLAGARDEAALVQSLGVWRWDRDPRYGAGLVELVTGRLAELDDDARAAVEVIACAEPVAAAIVDGLAGIGAVQPAGVVRAERGGFLMPEGDGRREMLRTALPIHGEVIRAVLPASRTRQIMRWLVAAAEAAPTEATAAHRHDDAQLVAWQLAAGIQPGRPTLMTAAAGATLRADLAAAERFVLAARGAVPGRRGTDPVNHALARILTWQGRHREATQLIAGNPADDDIGRGTCWAVTRAWNRYWGSQQYPEAIAELSRVEAESPHSRVRAEAAGARAWLLLYSGRGRQAPDAGNAGNALLTWPFPLAAAALISALAGRTAAALAASERGLGDAGLAAAGMWGQVMLGWSRCLALLLDGRVAQARTAAEDGYAAALEQSPDATVIAVWAMCNGKVARAQGRLAAAEAAFREAASLLDRQDGYHFSRYVLAELAGVRALAGDAPAAREWMRRSDARRTSANLMLEPWAELARAWVIGAGGELARAARHAGYAASLARDSGQHAVEAEALYDVIRFGHPARASARLRELVRTVDGALVPAFAAAAAAFRTPDAGRLADAAAEFAALGLPLHAAEAAGASARAHHAQGCAALASAARLRLAALLDACPAARTPLLRISAAETGPALTPREREIALMASSGLSSKDIAAKANLSVRTVSNHLGRVYAKLNVGGRGELTAHLDRLPDSQRPG